MCMFSHGGELFIGSSLFTLLCPLSWPLTLIAIVLRYLAEKHANEPLFPYQLLVFGLAGTLGGNPDGTVSDPGIGKVLIVSACMFILGYASTWAPGIWLFCGESFSRRTRAKQAALATSSNWTWNFLTAFFSRAIADNIGFRYGFVFAGANFLNMIVAMFFVYETNDLTLEGNDEMYGSPDVNAWTNRSYIPEGYTSRAANKTSSDVDSTVVGVPDEKQGRWKSKPDPITGEETDTVRKSPETKIKDSADSDETA